MSKLSESTVTVGTTTPVRSESADAIAETEAGGPRSKAKGDTLPAGASIGRYVIQRLIGEGGMGAVYEGQHRDLGKRSAIKTLHPHVARSPEVRARFVREGQAVSKIRHDHVVDVYDVGVEGDLPYLVMEFLEGEDLSALLAREGRLPVDRVATLMVPVLSALAAAHDLGIVHRDLKPENIYLCRDQGQLKPKVLDFGISKLVDDGTAHALTGTSALLGTPFYMSPEQAQNAKSIDARSDQFSLGVILYEAAAGRRPFAAETLYTLLQSIVNVQCPSLAELAPELPAEFVAVVARAMARDPADRFPSVRALGAALLPFADERTRLLFGGAFADSGAPPPPALASSPRAASATPAASYPGAITSPAAASGGSGRAIPLALGAAALAGIAVFFLTRGAPAPPVAAAPAVAPPAATAPAAPSAAAAPIAPPPAPAVTAPPEASASATASAAVAAPTAAPRPAAPRPAGPSRPAAPKLAPR